MTQLEVVALRADTHGCFADRIKQPFQAMNRAGLGVHGSWTDTLLLKDVVAGKADLLVGNRVSTPEMADLWKVFFHPAAPACCIDFDDDLFHVPPANPAHETYSKPETQRLMRMAMFASDALTVSTRPLASELAQFNEHVFVFPNTLPARFLRRPRRENRRPIVGWAGGASHLEDIRLLKALPADLRLRLYGCDHREVIGRPDAEFVPWNSDRALYLRRLDLEIGLCPLVDNQFNRCKSPLKFLEHSFRGIATVASPTVYADFIEHGVTGFIAETADEWAGYVDLLVHDPALRYEIAANAHEYVAANWTTEAHVETRAAVYREIVARSAEWRAPKWEQLVAEVPDAGHMWLQLYGLPAA